MSHSIEALRDGWYISDDKLLADLNNMLGSANNSLARCQLNAIVDAAIDSAYLKCQPFFYESGEPARREDVLIMIDNSDHNCPLILFSLRPLTVAPSAISLLPKRFGHSYDSISLLPREKPLFPPLVRLEHGEKGLPSLPAT
jgi:hypothetical protein